MSSRLLFAIAVLCSACHAATNVAAIPLHPDSLAIRRDIDYLASERLAGRLTGTPGNDSAAAYLARRYAALRLRAAAPGYFQSFVARPAVRSGPTPSLPTQNVFAVLPGRDRALSGEYIIIGAHFDHLGTSTEFALDPDARGAVRRGADDNASGTAAVLELARLFSASPARRSIIFVNFSGEEEGDLGSNYFVAHSPVPIDSIDAMLNLDMVGRLRNNRLIVYGVGTAAELSSVVEDANRTILLTIAGQSDGHGNSDQDSFLDKKIPSLHFFTDLHEDYHRASDVPEKINGAGEARVVALTEAVARAIADRPARLTFVQIEAHPQTASGPGGSDVYLGSVPDMAGGDGPGLKLTGVRAGSPAEQAGIKAEDVIVEFDGKPVKNIYEYSDALYAHKAGDSVTIVVLRAGVRIPLRVKLGKRGG